MQYRIVIACVFMVVAAYSLSSIVIVQSFITSSPVGNVAILARGNLPAKPVPAVRPLNASEAVTQTGHS